MAKLIYQDPDSGQEVSVDIGPDFPEVTIGRNPGNIVRINNPSISRKHAKLVYDGGQVTLYDLNSSNGSYVNGNRIQNQVLADGDRVRIGEFPVDFVDQGVEQIDQLEVGPIDEMPDPVPASNHPSRPDPGGGAAAQSHGQGLSEPTGTGGDSNAPVQFGGGGDDFEDGAVMLDDDDFEEIADQAVSDALADGGDPRPYPDDPDTASESPDRIGQMYDDTTNAPPEEIARGLAASAIAGDGADKVDSLREELEQVRRERDEFDDKNRQLTDELEQVRRERDELDDKNRQLTDELAQARAELEEAPDSGELRRLEDDLAQARDDVRMRDETIDSLQAQIEELETELDELEASAAAEPGEDTLREEFGETEELVSQIGELKAEREHLRERVEQLEEDQQKKKAIFEELSNDLRQLVAQNRELQERVAGLEEGSAARSAAAEG